MTYPCTVLLPPVQIDALSNSLTTGLKSSTKQALDAVRGVMAQVDRDVRQVGAGLCSSRRENGACAR
jgi:hypothetical protein